MGSSLTKKPHAAGPIRTPVVLKAGHNLGSFDCGREEITRWLKTRDRDAIEAAQKALALGTETFAADRMNRGIRQALAGRRLEDV